jgi:hypothetical protein
VEAVKAIVLFACLGAGGCMALSGAWRLSHPGWSPRSSQARTLLIGGAFLVILASVAISRVDGRPILIWFVGLALLAGGVLILLQALGVSPFSGAPSQRRPALPQPWLFGVAAGAGACCGAVLWLFGPEADRVTERLPPLEAAVNAETGAVEKGIRIRGAESDAQISGGNIFRACNLSAEEPCEYPLEPMPVRAEIGDLLNLKLRVDDPSYTQLPYAKFGFRWSFTDLPGDRSSDRLITHSQIRAEMSIRWRYPNRAGIGTPTVEPVLVQVPLAGNASALMYVPGSTRLLDSHSHLLARLPDGIAGKGIALTNIGMPPGCYECDGLSFIRFIEFKVVVGKQRRL